MSKKIMLTVFVVIVLIGLISLFFVYKLLHSDYYQEVTLSENTNISSNWSEIKTDGLIPIKKEKQFVSLFLESKFKVDSGRGGIITPDGAFIYPDIKIIDNDGKEYDLKYIGSRGFPDEIIAQYGGDVNFSGEKTYPKLLIKSNQTFSVEKIVWTGYDTKDLP